MDLSILAAVGSFFISERMLPPKALVMVGLAGLLAHDLATHSNDPASLRIYRGPGFLAFALFCGALSLRMWRRNNIACDELLFLPGTPLEDEHARHPHASLESALLRPIAACGLVARRGSSSTPGSASRYTNRGRALSGSYTSVMMQEEGEREQKREDATPPSSPPGMGMHRTTSAAAAGVPTATNATRIQEGGESSRERLRQVGSFTDDDSTPLTATSSNTTEEDEDSEQRTLMRSFFCGFHRLERFAYRLAATQAPPDATDEPNPPSSDPNTPNSHTTTNSNTQAEINWAYAPSSPSVLGAALDLSMPVFFNFHLFIAAFNHPRYAEAQTPKIFPLIFLSVLTLRAIFPRGKRRRFWSSLQYTLCAPLYKVNFRDEIIAEVLTSFVRPLQDVLFAYFYYITVVFHGVKEAPQICEQSWILHVLVLPSCAILPLWWRTLQCLRQARDANSRWPHLGNALKYMSAAWIVLYDWGHPAEVAEDFKTWWVCVFLLAVLYQVGWDVVMDWDLFRVVWVVPSGGSGGGSSGRCSVVLANAHRDHSLIGKWTQFLRLGWEFLKAVCKHYGVAFPLVKVQSFSTLPPSSSSPPPPTTTSTTTTHHNSIFGGITITLRPQRMYKSKSLYYTIFAFNSLMRFCWMLSFIPAKHMTSTGKVVHSYSADVQSYVGPMIACAEICRRCLWGLLKVEVESMRLYQFHGEEEEEGEWMELVGKEDGTKEKEMEEALQKPDSVLSASHAKSKEDGLGGATIVVLDPPPPPPLEEAPSSSVSSLTANQRSAPSTPTSRTHKSLMYHSEYEAVPTHPDNTTPHNTNANTNNNNATSSKSPTVLERSTSKGDVHAHTIAMAGRFVQRLDACLDRTLPFELCLWAVAFVGLGVRAVFC